MKRVAILTRGLAFGLAFGAGACSGVSDPGTIGNPGMSSPGDASTVDQASPVGDDASVSAEASPTVDASPAADVAVGVPEAAVVDATPDVGVDTIDAGRDAGAPGPDAGGGTFECGANATCLLGAETCCVQAANGQVTQACATGIGAAACQAQPGTVTALRCVATGDCATGSLCCLTPQNMAGGAATSQCRILAQCPAAQQQLCDPGVPVGLQGCPPMANACRAPVAMGGGGTRLPATVGVCQ